MSSNEETATGPQGLVFDIKRFAVHDGPGIRTTVFLKGCPLSCVWCHNPESISSPPEISFVAERCIGCGLCVAACEYAARRNEEGRIIFDRSKCTACGACAEVCPTSATEVVGTWQTLDEVWAEVIADQPFYERSGGGLTISGGEPLAQFEFTLALARHAHENAVPVCLDTCGYAPPEHIRMIAPWVDLFLYDIKETDPVLHQQYTGVSNEGILANLRLVDELGRPIILRCPIIPAINLREGYLEGLAQLYHSLDHCVALHLMPYHNLAESKYVRMGIEPPPLAVCSPAPEQVAGWLARLRDLGVPAQRA